MNCSIVPQERLRVFISSAQNIEKGFAWSEVRRRIKDHLSKCPYLNPFIIEDVASEIPSNQFFEYQVQQSDIIVLLVKGELRKGTATEFAVATKNKKPLLVYFLDDDSPNPDVEELKKEIQNTDYCTYHYLKNFDNIEFDIRNEIIEDVIRYYQFKHFQDIYVSQNAITDGNEINPVAIYSAEPSKINIPTKISIGLFKSCYNSIYDLLGIPQFKQENDSENSSFHKLGTVMLEWLVLGNEFDCEAEIYDLIEYCECLYGCTDWLKKRWEAIKYESSGQPQKALEAELLALEYAKKANLPQWIINDILIDCRNIETDINNLNHDGTYLTEAQKELDKSETIVYMPVLDRYLENVYESILKEDIKINTAKVGTKFYGNSLSAVLTDIENYFFSALLYGSYSHLYLSRKTLSNILYKYAELSGDSSLFMAAIKLRVLYGSEKEFQLLVQKKWDDVYSCITSNANDLWELSKKAPISFRDTMMQSVLSFLGLYFTDNIFREAETYLDTFSSKVYWGNSEYYFDCILKNISRINQKRVVEMLVGIIKERRFNLGDKLSNILLRINLSTVDCTLQNLLCDALVEQINYIVCNNGSPQLIAALENQNEEVFSVLSSVPENGLVGVEKTLYDINKNNGDWNKMLAQEIVVARQQFEKNNNTSAYSEFFEQPYAMISKIVREHYAFEMNETIVSKFFPLCIDVFRSNVVGQIKEKCINCLCDVLIFGKKFNLFATENLINSISEIDVSKCRFIRFISQGAEKIFSYRVLLLKVIIDIANNEELLELCIGYNNRNVQERLAIIECIEQLLIHKKDQKEKIDTAILAVILQCVDDKYYMVRNHACDCLVNLLSTPSRDIAEQKLYEAVLDTSHYVRNHILFLCKNEDFPDLEISEKIIEILKKDANFAIRDYALNA